MKKIKVQNREVFLLPSLQCLKIYNTEKKQIKHVQIKTINNKH